MRMKNIPAFIAFLAPAAACVALPPHANQGRPDFLRAATLSISALPIPVLNIESIDACAAPEIKSAVPAALEIPEIQPGIDDFRAAGAKLLPLLGDRRNAAASASMLGNRAAAGRWLEIYRTGFPAAERIPLPSGVRMIAEVRLPQDADHAAILEDNLKIRKEQGFNAVLMTFDGTENPADLVALARHIKTAGFNVWFAFGGREDLKAEVFPDPERLAGMLKSLAEVSDGFFACWRRTSAHLFVQDDAFMAFTAACVRLGSPKIPMAGEIYRGVTGDSGGRTVLTARAAAGSGGMLVVNLGAGNVAVESVMNGLLADYKSEPLYILVTGERSYMPAGGDMRAIRRIEDRWLKAGAAGTVVMHAGGSDEGFVSDDMSVYRINSN